MNRTNHIYSSDVHSIVRLFHTPRLTAFGGSVPSRPGRRMTPLLQRESMLNQTGRMHPTEGFEDCVTYDKFI